MVGKGSRNRTTNQAKFGAGWDLIWGKRKALNLQTLMDAIPEIKKLARPLSKRTGRIQ